MWSQNCFISFCFEKKKKVPLKDPKEGFDGLRVSLNGVSDPSIVPTFRVYDFVQLSIHWPIVHSTSSWSVVTLEDFDAEVRKASPDASCYDLFKRKSLIEGENMSGQSYEGKLCLDFSLPFFF